MKEMFLDAETYSDLDLSKCGVYRYVESDQFELLLLSINIDGSGTITYDLASGDVLPSEIIAAIKDPNVKKWAFNANFERIVLSRYFGLPSGSYLDPSSWYCDMILASYVG